MKKVLGCLRRAAEEFDMLHSGESIAVGVSGGKDSMLLLHALWLYKKFMKLNYELKAITVDLGFPGFDTSGIAAFAAEREIPYIVKKTDIAEIVFDIRKEDNPCSLCSKMRKGAFYTAAKEEGCGKAAFAHSADDLIETLLMSLMYEGRLHVFRPVTFLSRQEITLIRPFVYLPEKEVIGAVKRLGAPVVKNPCPMDGVSKRQEAKELIRSLAATNPHIKQSLLNAIRNTEGYALWGD